MSELISVVVPVYNVEEYLPKCIKSIVSQTYREIEIILVDDGSTDKSAKICDEAANKDNRIIVIHKENGGLSDARNKGIDVAKGKYISFIDSDDYIEPTYFEYLYDLLEKKHSDISICGFKYVSEKGKLLNKICDDECSLVMSTEESLKEMLKMKLYSNSAWAKLYSIELFSGVRYPKGEFFEDIATTYRLFMKAKRIAYGSNALYCYLYRDSAISKQVSKNRRLDALKSCSQMINDIVAVYPSLDSVAKCRIFSTYIGTFEALELDTDKELSDKIYNSIKEIRMKVLFDKSSKLKKRLICVLSYLPKRVFHHLLVRYRDYLKF